MTLSAPNRGIEIFNGTKRRLAVKKADFRADFIRFSGLSVPMIRYGFQIAKMSVLTDMRSARACLQTSTEADFAEFSC